MRRIIYFGAMAFFLAIFPASEAVALHCQPYWTAAYKCAMGCGSCGGGGGGGGGGVSAPVYSAPAPPQPSREELLRRQATALNNQGVTFFNKHKFREAIRLFESSLKVLPSQQTRENLGGAYNQLALEYYNKGDYKEAARYMALAGQYKPGDNQISSNLEVVRGRIESERAEEAGRAAVSKSLDHLTEVVTNMQVATTVPGLDFDNGGNGSTSTSPAVGLGFLPANSATQVASVPGGNPAARVADVQAPPPNPTLPRVAEIENSPGAGEARKAFQAIIAKDWPVAIVWYKQALLKDPNNAALKRSLDLAEYTVTRRLEIARQNSPMWAVLDMWSSGDDKTALIILKQVEKEHPEMKARVADVRHGLLAVDKYRHSPDYRAAMAKMAKEANELVLDGMLEMAQRSMIDEYVDKALRNVSSGNIPEARLMLKTALASDESRGDVRVLLDAVETLETGPDLQSLPLPSGVHN